MVNALMLCALYALHPQQKYGGYMEDQWCEMYLPSNVVYYNKLTGQLLTGGRPEDFRPYLKVNFVKVDYYSRDP